MNEKFIKASMVQRKWASGTSSLMMTVMYSWQWFLTGPIMGHRSFVFFQYTAGTYG
ncbi:hypothetical protein [Planomicrobium soli]|uniref:hypothetical protein n=1 Tax=Planomicrobium soli TaxID=1176648 RepID=UPI0015E758C2|nr:hypothetical protein [Planomicrobium soli]